MSNIEDPPEQQYTLEQINAGLDKFLTTVEEEIEIHHAHPEWIDYDQKCTEEKNLIIRAELILTMLEEIIKQVHLPVSDPNFLRIKAARQYFDRI